jgi:hypothetical protein
LSLTVRFTVAKLDVVNEAAQIEGKNPKDKEAGDKEEAIVP